MGRSSLTAPNRSPFTGISFLPDGDSYACKFSRGERKHSGPVRGHWFHLQIFCFLLNAKRPAAETEGAGLCFLKCAGSHLASEKQAGWHMPCMAHCKQSGPEAYQDLELPQHGRSGLPHVEPSCHAQEPTPFVT